MSKNIVICCDGTGNEVDGDLSNVLKLFRIIKKNDDQIAYYQPGIGTIGQRDEWARIVQNAKGVFGLATGYGLDDDILNAYGFLAQSYEDGDRIFLFGFSRGAYTVRILAGVIHLLGLLRPEQLNLSGYLLSTYKRCGEHGDMALGWDFRRVMGSRTIQIAFLGMWDAVATVIVPRKDRMYFPSIRTLPYTRTNPSVAVVRHGISIDERRRMFRLNRWIEPQTYKRNPFLGSKSPVQQDIKQVWFSGVHADVGGGYAENESGLSKFPLNWIIDEAKVLGLVINTALKNHVVTGRPRRGSKKTFASPDATAVIHNSLTPIWRALEFLPKNVKWQEWPRRRSVGRWYLPRGEPRVIEENALIHYSVFERITRLTEYRPENLPKLWRVEQDAQL